MKINMSEVSGAGGRFDFPRVRLKTNEVARLNMFSTKHIEATVRHWVNKFGYVHCLALPKMESLAEMVAAEEEGGKPDDCYLCKVALDGHDAIGVPNCRFATRVLRYKTDMTGRVIGELSYWMEIWIFDGYKFRDVKKKQDEWGSLANHDLTLTCDNEKFQNVTINVQKQALWKQDRDKVKEHLGEEAKKYDLMKCLGRVVPEDALRRRFALQERRTEEETPVDLEEDVLTSEEPVGEKAAQAEVGSEEVFETDAKGKGDGELPAIEAAEESETDFLDEVLKEEK